MNSSEQILVTGASGWIGQHVCRYLKAQGYGVVACDLHPHKDFRDAWIQCDISRSGGFPGLDTMGKVLVPGSPRYLIHCAGYAHRPVETPEEIDKFDRINAEGTRRTLDWARAIGVSRFLYVSSVAFYDWTQSGAEQSLDEDSRLVAKTAYARSKLKGEDYVRNDVMDTRIVRLCTVFGEGDPANFSRLAGALKRKRFLLPGKGHARKSVISVDKAAEWISRFILMDAPPHSLVNLGFRKAPTLREICLAFHDACGFNMPISLPVGVLKGMALAGDMISRFRPGFPLTTSTLRKLICSTRVDCSKASDMFDNDCDFRTSLRASASYYKEL